MHIYLIMYTCKIIMYTCTMIMYTYILVKYTCKIIMYACKIVMYTCKKIMYTQSHDIFHTRQTYFHAKKKLIQKQHLALGHMNSFGDWMLIELNYRYPILKQVTETLFHGRLARQWSQQLRQPLMLCCHCLLPGSLHVLGAFGSLS